MVYQPIVGTKEVNVSFVEHETAISDPATIVVTSNVTENAVSVNYAGLTVVPFTDEIYLRINEVINLNEIFEWLNQAGMTAHDIPSMQDYIATNLTKVASESTALSDTLIRIAVNKVVAEESSLIDSISMSLVKTPLIDNTSLSDIVSKIVSKELSVEVTSIADSYSLNTHKVLGEVSNISDSTVYSVHSTNSESLGLTDSLVKNISLSYSESISLVEVNVQQTLVSLLYTTLTPENASINDIFSMGISLSFVETTQLYDSMFSVFNVDAPIWHDTSAEQTYISEIFNKSITLDKLSTAYATDSISLNINKLNFDSSMYTTEDYFLEDYVENISDVLLTRDFFSYVLTPG